MRPGQNKRMRGRNNNNNNNRKGPNPLTRSYESNGPDVKIRGTAHHIGEKYLQLARDAQSSGDPVMAESYLQHAEHYFRLIAAAQQAQQQAAYGYQQRTGEEEDEDNDDDFVSLPDRFASPSERAPPAPPPQPYADRQPFPNGQQQPYEPRQERPLDRQNGGQQYQDRQPSGDRQDRPYEARNSRGDRYQDRGYQDRNNQDRGGQDRNTQDRGGQDRGGPDRGNQDRNSQDRSNQDRTSQDRTSQDRSPDRGNGPERAPRDFDNRAFRNNRGPRDFREGNGQPREAREPRQPATDEPAPTGLPAFITAPSRVIPESEPQPSIPDVGGAPTDGGDEGFHLRPRRRRRPKPEFAGEAEGGEHEAPAGDPVGE